MTAESLAMDAWECESLLRAHVVGRVGLVAPDGPHVLPVNYSVVGGAIILRTAADGLLGSLPPDEPLAFEIDQFDHERQRGWSVLVRGPVRPVTDAAELARIEAVWPPHPWASGARPVHLRLRWRELTGRKLGTGWDPGRSTVVRRTV